DVVARARPALAAIAGDADHAVVAAGPDGVGVGARKGDRNDGVVGLGAGDVVDDFAAAVDLLRFVVAGEVGADRGPTEAAIGGVEQHIAAHVDIVGALAAHFDRRGPVEAVLQRAGNAVLDPEGVGLDVARKPGSGVQALC